MVCPIKGSTYAIPLLSAPEKSLLLSMESPGEAQSGPMKCGLSGLWEGPR